LSRNKKQNKTIEKKLKVLGMGGNGTNQQKHRENQKKTIFQRSWGWGGLAQSKKKHRENQKKTKKKQKQQKKQYSRGLGDGEVPPRVSKYCFFVFVLFFLVFSMFFDFSPWGPPQRDSKYFFLCYHYMEVYTVFFFRLWY